APGVSVGRNGIQRKQQTRITMKASTFFALIIALLLGLTALAVARFFGMFNRQPAVVAPRVEPVELPKILVAKKNLYEGYAMLPTDVKVRPVYPYELEDYKANPRKYMPATVDAA